MYTRVIYLLMIAISYLHLIPQFPLDNGCRLSFCVVLASCIVKTSSCCLRAGQYHDRLLTCFTTDSERHIFRSGVFTCSHLQSRHERQLVHFKMYSRPQSSFSSGLGSILFSRVSPLVSHLVQFASMALLLYTLSGMGTACALVLPRRVLVYFTTTVWHFGITLICILPES